MSPGSSSGSCFFVEDSLPLLVLFGAGRVLRYFTGLNGWDWLCELMMVSQMMAWDGGASGDKLVEGYVAEIQTNNCFVFQLKSDVKSTSRLIIETSHALLGWRTANLRQGRILCGHILLSLASSNLVVP